MSGVNPLFFNPNNVLIEQFDFFFMLMGEGILHRKI